MRNMSELQLCKNSYHMHPKKLSKGDLKPPSLDKSFSNQSNLVVNLLEYKLIDCVVKVIGQELIYS